jgi:hypothetical protein
MKSHDPADRGLFRQRVVLIARWPILLACLAGIGAWLFLYGTGSCAPGAPSLDTGDLVRAEFAAHTKSDGTSAETLAIDLSDANERARLLTAYQSMTPVRDELGKTPPPDLDLTLVLAGDRRIMIFMSRDNYPDVLLTRYEGEKAIGSVFLHPNQMYEYMIELADRLGSK